MEPDGRIFQPTSSDGSAQFFDRRWADREDEGQHSPPDDGLAVGVGLVHRYAVQQDHPG